MDYTDYLFFFCMTNIKIENEKCYSDDRFDEKCKIFASQGTKNVNVPARGPEGLIMHLNNIPLTRLYKSISVQTFFCTFFLFFFLELHFLNFLVVSP